MYFIIDSSLKHLPEAEFGAIIITQRVPKYLSETDWWLAKGNNHRVDYEYGYRELTVQGKVLVVPNSKGIEQLCELAHEEGPVVLYEDEGGNLIIGSLSRDRLNELLINENIQTLTGEPQ